ncbi:hypothetical protein QVD17_18577 [Tagetes erecta]|uniref:Uncharacterized protein n=1 Tax=Tagetes erecta TaxID=13708 RepID=A0AAD8KID1_TARER|nr:hypothetical protein QVD17_18577 [Tagetes erecta]
MKRRIHSIRTQQPVNQSPFIPAGYGGLAEGLSLPITTSFHSSAPDSFSKSLHFPTVYCQITFSSVHTTLGVVLHQVFY